jgi:RNA polymerase sigma factor (sigma-70 family)
MMKKTANLPEASVSFRTEKEKENVPTQREFEEWVREHQPMIYQLALRLTGNEDDALDCTQETFIRAYRHREQYSGDAPVGAWLRKIAVNHTYNFLTRNKTRNWNDYDEQINHSPEETEEEERRFDPRHLEVLSPLEKSVIVARIYQNMPFRELAEAVGTTENSAKVSFHRAVQKLRKVMK